MLVHFNRTITEPGTRLSLAVTGFGTPTAADRHWCIFGYTYNLINLRNLPLPWGIRACNCMASGRRVLNYLDALQGTAQLLTLRRGILACTAKACFYNLAKIRYGQATAQAVEQQYLCHSSRKIPGWHEGCCCYITILNASN
jgi:hypothetical protein